MLGIVVGRVFEGDEMMKVGFDSGEGIAMVRGYSLLGMRSILE